MHIHEFQKMMEYLYFERDSKRGKDGTFVWLIEELNELKEALNKGDKRAIEEEFADVFAWLSSLANILDVNLEKVSILKYNNKCPKCNLNPCKCPF